MFNYFTLLLCVLMLFVSGCKDASVIGIETGKSVTIPEINRIVAQPILVFNGWLISSNTFYTNTIIPIRFSVVDTFGRPVSAGVVAFVAVPGLVFSDYATSDPHSRGVWSTTMTFSNKGVYTLWLVGNVVNPITIDINIIPKCQDIGRCKHTPKHHLCSH